MQYNSNHTKIDKASNLSSATTILITICLCLCLSVAGTVAWLTTVASTKNTFTIGTVNVEVQENFDPVNKLKSDVYFKNTSNSPVYIRAIVSIYWKDVDGFIITETPEPNIDYNIMWNTSSDNWFCYEDIYYYKIALNENCSTDVLIKECQQIRNYDDGRTLVVDIACQSIQAIPNAVVEEAWNVTLDENGNIRQQQGGM